MREKRVPALVHARRNRRASMSIMTPARVRKNKLKSAKYIPK